MARTIDTTHPGRDATHDTAPFTIWSDAVYSIAGTSVEDARKYATRERIQRAYQAGEPAWMAADMVRQFVTVGRREDRSDDDVEALRRAVRYGATAGRPHRTAPAVLDREIAEALRVDESGVAAAPAKAKRRSRARR